MTIETARLNRIRWRARRGLVENDIVLARFFAQHEATLSEDEVDGLDALLELSDNDLLDLILKKNPDESAKFAPEVWPKARHVLQILRTV